MKRKYLVLICLLLATAVAVGCVGAYLKYRVLRPLELLQDGNVFEVPFLLLSDDGARYTLQRELEQNRVSAETTEPEPSEIQQPETEVSATESESYPPETQPPETEPEEIDETWFDDALFIGDSRTVGLRDSARLGKAQYFCDLSMTVFKVLQYTVYDRGFGRAHLKEALEENTYGKVFIHLGLNECGTDHDLVMEKYQEIVDLIQETQPDARIYIQAIMTVTKYKANDPKFTIEGITDLNERLKALAEEEGTFFLDTNEWAADEDGYLRTDYNLDGAHLTGPGYQEWAQNIIEQIEQINAEINAERLAA